MTLAAGCLGLALATAYGGEVRVERIDGTTLSAQWMGSDSAGNVLVATENEQKALMAPSALAAVDFVGFKPTPPNDASRPPTNTDEPPTTPADLEAVFFLADGGSLVGRILGAKPEALLSRTALGDGLPLPFRSLAGVRLADPKSFVAADELFQAALKSRLPGLDVLVTLSTDAPKSLRGRLSELDVQKGAFAPAEGSTVKQPPRTFSIEKIYGVVFAVGIEAPKPHPVMLTLTDDSTVSGRLIESGPTALRFESSVGASLEFPIERVKSLTFRSDRMVFLSDLTPLEQRSEGLLHRPWETRFDRNVSLGPLVLDGRTFRKGLGMHSRGRITYALNGEFESFAATIGIDDAVRPRGTVVFRVLGTGDRVLLDSGTVTGRDRARDILVPLSGQDRVTLEVDFGDGLDWSDQADWGSARLIKPAAKP